MTSKTIFLFDPLKWLIIKSCIVVTVFFPLELSSQVFIDCEGCSSEQESFAHHIYHSKDRINLKPYQNVNVNFQFRSHSSRRGIFNIKRTSESFYTPFTYIAKQDFPVNTKQLGKFIKKVDFDQYNNYNTLLNTTEFAYNRDPAIPIKLEPFLPEYFANAIFIASLLDFQDTIALHFISKGYLDRKYSNFDVGEYKFEADRSKETRTYNFEYADLPLKDSTILEMYFRNLHDNYGRKLITIEKESKEYRQGFSDILYLIDSLGYDHYPDFINRKDESESSLFLKLQKYYVPSSVDNSLKNCLLAENLQLIETAFEMGNKSLFGRETKGSVLDTIFFLDRGMVYLSTNQESLLVDLENENLIETNKIDYPPSYHRGSYTVPWGKDVLLVSRAESLNAFKTIQNTSRGTFLTKNYLWYWSKSDFFIVQDENGSYLYSYPSFGFIDSTKEYLPHLTWMPSYSDSQIALDCKDEKSSIYVASNDGFHSYKFNQRLEHLKRCYFISFNPRTNKEGVVSLSDGNLRKVVPAKFDEIDFEVPSYDRSRIYFTGTKDSKSKKYKQNGRRLR